MKEGSELIALFDMDGTLCDYDTALFNDLEKLRSPGERPFRGYINGETPSYILNRANLIRSHKEWWVNIPKLKLGWDVLGVAKNLGYKIKILTQGPGRIPIAWTGKKEWIDRYFGEGMDLTLTRDKGDVYGRVLVDDYPDYVDKWLKWRKRGLVIMPANDLNSGYKHRQVIKYNGSNLGEVSEGMEKVKKNCLSNGYFGLQ
jgi:FMN phosphatase YigB (HAD superfamily)